MGSGISYEGALGRADELAPGWAARAPMYDREIRFPAEDFDELAEAGLLLACVPGSDGGLGVGPSNGRTADLWRLTAVVAGADLSLGRCFEGHCNSMDLVNGVGSAELGQRVFALVRDEGARFAFWGSEAGASRPGKPAATAIRVDGGWRLNGTKMYSTSAGGASHIFMLIGPHEIENSTLRDWLILLMPADAPGVVVDESWWHSLGMRATVSHRVELHDVFIPESDFLCGLDTYLDGRWQSRFLSHFVASFMGACGALRSFTIDYVSGRGKHHDPFVQHHIAASDIAIESTWAVLESVGRLWDEGRVEEAALASARARVFGEDQVKVVLDRVQAACGATALLDQHPLGRIMRDLLNYTRHENVDLLRSTIGRAALGLDFEPNFGNSSDRSNRSATGTRG